LIEARDERSFLRLKTQLAKLDLLVLDELGYVPASKIGAELLFDVISTAYERTSLIVTTNPPNPKPRRSGDNRGGSDRLTINQRAVVFDEHALSDWKSVHTAASTARFTVFGVVPQISAAARYEPTSR
jgi:DNA replication protein DnaC